MGLTLSMDKSKFELNEWQKKTGEDSSEYKERMRNKINLESIKQRFNYKIFVKLLNKRKQIFSAIQESCDADEDFWIILMTGQHDESYLLDRTFIDGSFFNFVSNNLIEYIPVAEWVIHSDDDDPESARQNKFGLLKFKKPLKYVMVQFSYIFPNGNDFWTADPFLKFDKKKKINNNTIKKYISEIIKEEISSLRFIYLNKKFNWNLKSFVKNLPGYNLYDITTKLWLTDFSIKEYAESWKMKFYSPLPKGKPDFSKKFPGDE